MGAITSLSQITPNQRVLTFKYTGGVQSFVIPTGYQSTIDAYMWGGGGAGGGSDSHIGGSGAGGNFIYAQFPVGTGDSIAVAVGGGGHPGGSGSGSGYGPGGNGITNIGGYQFNGADGGNPGPQGWSGGGGGGGAASVIFKNGTPICVAGGGGGAGGGGNFSNGLDALGGGTPGTIPMSSSTLWGTYPAFLNNHGVWGSNGGSFDQTFTVHFPITATYTIQGTADNEAHIYIDGVEVLSGADWGTVYTTTYTVSAGMHSVRMYGINWGGPASIACTIDGPGVGTIFDSLYPPAYNYAPCQQGQYHAWDGGGGGGGGAGWPGGAGGGNGQTVGGSDNGGGPGLSGSSYGYVTFQDGYGQRPGGSTNPFYNSCALGGGPGGAGSAGLIVLVLTFRGIAQFKNNGQWNPLLGSWVKVNGVWKNVAQTSVKHNGVWVPTAGAPITPGAPNAANFGNDQSLITPYPASPPHIGDSDGDDDGD